MGAMVRKLFLLLFSATSVFAQSTDAWLELLVMEVRQMRADLATMALTTQRVQLVLYRLQLQQEVVRRAQQRSEIAAARVASLDRARNQGQDELKQLETRLGTETDPLRKRQMEMQLEMVKRQMQRGPQEESQMRAEQADAERDLRAEQARAQELQQKLDEMEKTLERLTAPPQRPPGQR